MVTQKRRPEGRRLFCYIPVEKRVIRLFLGSSFSLDGFFSLGLFDGLFGLGLFNLRSSLNSFSLLLSPFFTGSVTSSAM